MTAAADAPAARPTRPPVELPARWPWLFRGFRKYGGNYLRKHFHAVRLANAGAPVPAGDAPVLVVMNHPSWWDALTPLALLDRFPATVEHFAAIDARAFAKYGFFKRVGFFGVDTQSVRGAAAFLRTGEAILSVPNRVVWVTAQGQFTDVRVRPLNLRSGVGHLAARMATSVPGHPGGRDVPAGGFVLPVGVEYPFWNERTPEALIRIGTPLNVADGAGLSGKAWTAKIEAALTETLDALAADALTRDPARFTTLLGGTVGVGGVYDRWRRLKAWATRTKFDASHGGAEA